MNISSTPFIRNDYWPDYNDIDILNKRIDEAENETSLVNSRLTNDIENVSNNLNSYKNAMADAVITNNIIVNNLNANYVIGKYANFVNTNTDNAYIENLTVNKPVFDITLNTPHVENITSIGGNFYDSTLVNAMLDGNGVLGNVEINNAVINTANVSELFVNTNPEPVTSSAVLGYDSEGRVIPIKAAFEVGFPENANYLYTDQHGTAFPGIAETEVNASDNLITSYAVYNALANVNNSFNAVNNFVNNGFNDVNIFVNNGFNNVANELNDAYNIINSLQDKIRILSLNDANEYWSGAPVNYQNVTRIVFKDSGAGTQISGKSRPVNIAFNSTSNTLEFCSSNFTTYFNTETFAEAYQPRSLLQIFNRDISYLFMNCKKLNFIGNPDPVSGEFNFNFCEPTGNFITSMSSTFTNCSILDQNILIPNSVVNMRSTFTKCVALNKNILIPNSVTDMGFTFDGCNNLNQPNMYIFSQNITDMGNAFRHCHVDKIHIPTSVPKDTSNFMYNCLVNGNTGITFPASNIFNDLPVDIEQWPPV